MSEPLREKPVLPGPVSALPLLLLGAIIGLLPMIVYMRLVTFDGVAGETYGPSIQGDLFSFYKSVWTCILAATAMVWYRCNRTTAANWYHQPLAVYSFFIIVSTIFADHWQIAFFGDPHRHEGMLVHLSYMSIIFLFINLTESRRELKILLGMLLVSATILAVAGIAQFLGANFLYSEMADWLIVPDKVRQLQPDINLSRLKGSMHSIFLTFGNGNFTGSYMAMLFALTLALALLVHSRLKFALIPINLLIFCNLLGSKSRAGFLGAVIAGLVLLAFLWREIWPRKRRLALLIGCFCLMPFVMDAFTWQEKEVPRFLETSIARPVSVKSGLFGNFQDLKLATDSFTFVFDDLKTEVRLNGEKLEFYDHKGELVPYSLLPNPNLRTDNKSPLASFTALASGVSSIFQPVSGSQAATVAATGLGATRPTVNQTASGTGSGFFASKEYLVLFPEKKMRGFLIYAWPEHNVLEIGRGGVSFYVVATGSGFKLINQFGKAVDIQEVETLGFAGCQGLGSNRGYIWSRTLPMLKKALLIGYGPDTFAFHFPNHDYLGKLRVWPGGIFTMIEKPHNLYLQIAINSGVISLLAILALFAVYLHASAKIYWKCRFENFSEMSGLGIMAAIVAYLVAAFFNDSIVGIAPVFWGLLGMGIAANRINLDSKKQLKRVEAETIMQIDQSEPETICHRKSES